MLIRRNPRFASFHGIQGALRRDHRLFVGVDAADGGVHVVSRPAVGAFQLLAGADEVVLRLFDLRVTIPP